MSNPAVLIAVRRMLSEISGLPTIVWPNQAIPVEAPFLIYDNGFTGTTTLTIDNEERFVLSPQISYLAKLGTYTAEGDAAFWAIAQAFKLNTKITATDNTVLGYSLQTPISDGGYTDSGFYRRNLSLQIASDQIT